MSDEQPFYSPNYRPKPRQPEAGELLIEFARVSDKRVWRCELQHKGQYGRRLPVVQRQRILDVSVVAFAWERGRVGRSGAFCFIIRAVMTLALVFGIIAAIAPSQSATSTQNSCHGAPSSVNARPVTITNGGEIQITRSLSPHS